MRSGSVSWSIGRSPDLMVEVWSTAATMEAVLRVLAGEKKEVISALLRAAYPSASVNPPFEEISEEPLTQNANY